MNNAAILHILYDKLPISYDASLFSKPRSTITATRAMNPEELVKAFLFVKQNSDKRQRISYSETQQFQEFLKMKYPIPSVYKDEKCVQAAPIHRIYQEFLE